MSEILKDSRSFCIDELAYLIHLEERPGYQLAFNRDVEIQYINWLQQHKTNYFIAIPVIMTTIWFCFLVADVVRAPVIAMTLGGEAVVQNIITARIVVLVVELNCTYITYKHIVKKPSQLLMSCYFVLCIGTAFISYTYHSHGEYLGGWLPVILIVPLFMIPSGCLFKHACSWGVLTTIAYLILYEFIIDTDEGHFTQLYYFSILLCLGVGVSCGYYKERLLRTLFIKTRVSDLRSLIDPLTNIGNRRYFETVGKIVLRNANRESKSVVFAMVDIDFFKRINDIHGHNVGDEVLTCFASELQGIARRPLDIVGRLGGEEFGILFYDITSQDACTALDKLQRKLSNTTTKPLDGLPNHSLSFSAGVCEIRSPTSLEQLYKEADGLLYKAKESGRRQVVANEIPN